MLFPTDWGAVILLSLEQVWTSVMSYVPALLGAIIVFIVGWIVAVSLGKVIEQVIKSLKVDAILEQVEFHKVLDRADIKLNSGAFIGGLVRWFLIIVFLLAALNILGLNEVSGFLRDVLGYIPRVVVAALILVIAALVANTVERTARASVESAGMKGSFVGVVARWAIWIFALITALYQLGVAPALLQTVVMGLIAMIAIAGGLAFGLGGKDMAGDILNRMRREISDKS